MKAKHKQHVVILGATIVKGIINLRANLFNDCLAPNQRVIDTMLLAIGVRVGGRLTAVQLCVHGGHPDSGVRKNTGKLPSCLIRLAELKGSTDTREVRRYPAIQINSSQYETDML